MARSRRRSATCAGVTAFVNHSCFEATLLFSVWANMVPMDVTFTLMFPGVLRWGWGWQMHRSRWPGQHFSTRIAVTSQREEGTDPNSSSCSRNFTKLMLHCSTLRCQGGVNWSWQHNLNPAFLCICIAITQTVITWSHIFAQMNAVVYKFTAI